MRKIILSLFCVLAVSNIFSQDIPEHISYTRIYDYLDELASEGVIELNSTVKPYSRQFIAEKLLQALTNNEQLNRRQNGDLNFFLNEFALEQNILPKTK